MHLWNDGKFSMDRLQGNLLTWKIAVEYTNSIIQLINLSFSHFSVLIRQFSVKWASPDKGKMWKFCGKFVIYFHIRIKRRKKNKTRASNQTERCCEIHRFINNILVVFGETVFPLAADCQLGQKPLPVLNSICCWIKLKFSFFIVWLRILFSVFFPTRKS